MPSAMGRRRDFQNPKQRARKGRPRLHLPFLLSDAAALPDGMLEFLSLVLCSKDVSLRGLVDGASWAFKGDVEGETTCL